MKYHQGIKAEIETRSKNFSTCLELGESLLQRQPQAPEEVSGTVSRRQAPLCPSSPLAGPDGFLGESCGLWFSETAHTRLPHGAVGCAQAHGAEPHQTHARHWQGEQVHNPPDSYL